MQDGTSSNQPEVSKIIEDSLSKAMTTQDLKEMLATTIFTLDKGRSPYHEEFTGKVRLRYLRLARFLYNTIIGLSVALKQKGSMRWELDPPIMVSSEQPKEQDPED